MASRSTAAKARPKYYDLNLLHLPPPGIVSILHRMTGVAMFLMLIPLALLVLQGTLRSEAEFVCWQRLLAQPIVKLVVLGFVWAYLHHFFAGIRYLLLDLHVGIDKAPARTSAKIVLVAGAAATLLVGARIW